MRIHVDEFMSNIPDNQMCVDASCTVRILQKRRGAKEKSESARAEERGEGIDICHSIVGEA